MSVLTDMMGQPIEVGDTITYVSDNCGPRLTLGTVSGVSYERGRVKVTRIHSSGGQTKVHEGHTKKWMWDSVNQTGYFANVPAKDVYIFLHQRCLVLKKGKEGTL